MKRERLQLLIIFLSTLDFFFAQFSLIVIAHHFCEKVFVGRMSNVYIYVGTSLYRQLARPLKKKRKKRTATWNREALSRRWGVAALRTQRKEKNVKKKGREQRVQAAY